ncbi:hypothetical protein DY000_02045371 [Brassica cretica]|uniref:Secreted protein n=1 Tax=Brassica cretica TaxID=69181 RepID=A0ABQ7ENX3_BRACR|nr:hypothetical protein DY000_02045371 [Brassica cretica]
MGLQGQLSDVSSDSLPLMLVSLLAVFLSRLRSLLLPPCDSASNLPLDDGSIIASQHNRPRRSAEPEPALLVPKRRRRRFRLRRVSVKAA